MTDFPFDYLERVYAGVLGKMIGVYLGRPVENSICESITERFGMVDRYVNRELGYPLVVTDDDIAGTFTFLRALQDYGYHPDLTSAQIGQTWLNYIIEGRTILWWGGLFHSTEHTAYINLKDGIPAPRSGSIELNGPVIANQIGAQIYIDGWALLHPGDPERAADFAARAASVSHDDEAVNAARVIAAMEAQAFVETDIDQLIDAGLGQISHNSLIYRLINDLCNWSAQDGDWRKTRERIVSEYGYKKYVGGCHVVPNHALIHLGLLYGQGDFRKSLAICVTAGWDTDCNAGNLGCLLAVRGGLAALDGSDVDWRGPVADRLLITNADGGRCITDAVRETLAVVNTARGLRGQDALHPKGGARFHFDLPGSIQGFRAEHVEDTRLENVPSHSRLGMRSLKVTHRGGQPGRISTAVFILPGDLNMGGYALWASPTLYPGQTVRAGVWADEKTPKSVDLQLYLGYYDADDRPARLYGERVILTAGEYQELAWQVPEINGIPYEIGIELVPTTTRLSAGDNQARQGESAASIYLDYLTWAGSPQVTLTRPQNSSLPFPGPMLFRRAWVDGVDHWEPWYQQSFRIIQDRGRGLILTGTREWTDYQISARMTSVKFHSGGIAARVQGMMRFYALELVEGGQARILKALDGDKILAEVDFNWETWRPYELRLAVENVADGCRLRGWIDGTLSFDVIDLDRPLTGGGVALVVERGHLAVPSIRVEPIQK